jgi:hypothetical protein
MTDQTTPTKPINTPHLGGVYVLLLGLVMGLLLGPMVLGRISSERYAALFPNPVAAQFKLDEIQKTRRTLAMTDVSPVALEEYDQQRQAEVQSHEQTIEKALKTRSIMDALLLGSLSILLVMNMSSGGSRLHHRLLLASHLLLGAWLCLFLTQPYLLARLSGWVIIGTLLITGIFLAAPPYQRKPQPDGETQ